ncbi:hypothetical protein SVAN01_05328 [Stagonosporopsis vannaccii]|nr:hypothetical protein SVAN01_05328 [Stagonosporopsis vannaccii]
MLALQLADPESRSQRPRAKRRVSRAMNGSTVQSNVGLGTCAGTSIRPQARSISSLGYVAPQVVPDLQQRAGTSGLPAHFPSRGSNSVQVRCVQGTSRVQIRSGGRVSFAGEGCGVVDRAWIIQRATGGQQVSRPSVANCCRNLDVRRNVAWDEEASMSPPKDTCRLSGWTPALVNVPPERYQAGQPPAAAIDDGVFIPVPATVPRPLLQLPSALVTSLSGALSSLLRETGASPRSRLERVTQLTSGSSQSVVHTSVAGSKTGSADPALPTVARASPATCILEL